MNYLIGGQTFGDRYGIDPAGLTLWLDQSDARSYGDLTNWYDLSGLNNHAVQAAGAKQPPITGANALAGSTRDFDGGADIMFVTDQANLSGIDISMVVWAKPEAATGGWLIYKGSTTLNREYALEVRTDKTSGRFFNLGSSSTYNNVTHEAALSGFIHVAVTYDDATNTSRLYLNGAEVASSNAVNITMSNQTSNLAIGAYGAESVWFNGKHSFAAVFTRELTAAEVQRLYLVDKPRYGGL